MSFVIAEQKKKENIIEYILYMWQIEDIIRSCQFNIYDLEKKVINIGPYSKSEKVELKNWYMDLMYSMESENIQEKGHLSELLEIQAELEHIHIKLIKVFQLESYQKVYDKVLPLIRELKKKSNDLLVQDVETCLQFMYGSLLLKLQQKSLSVETLEALKNISFLMYTLADKYNDQKEGFLNLSNALKN